MLLRRHMPYVIATLLLWCPFLYAQRVSIGPVAQGALNAPYASFPSLTDVPVCCSDFGIGAGLGAHLGLELITDIHPSASFSIRAMVGGARDVLWTNDQIGWLLRRTPAGNKVYPSYATYVLDIASEGVDVSALTNVHLGATSPWSFSVGVGVTSPVSMRYDQYEILDDDATQILNDSRLPQRDVSSGDITSRTGMHGRIIAGLRFDDDPGASSRMFYDVTANLGFDPVLNSGGGRLTAYSLRAAVGILFDLYSASDTNAPEPPREITTLQEQPPVVISAPIADIAEPEQPRQPAPTIEPVLQPEPIPQPAPETQSEPKPEPEPVGELPPVKDPVVIEFATVYQLLPYVFFKPGSSHLYQSTDLPDCREGIQQQVEQLIDTAMSSESYSVKHYAVNDNLLKIVGYRMKNSFPNAHLVIKGYVNGRTSDSTTGLARDRARAIATYLERCWNIDQRRLRVEYSDGMSPNACTYALRDERDVRDAEEENTRCELSSPHEPGLLSSVIARVSVAENELTSISHTNIVRVLSAPKTDISAVVAASGPPRGTKVVATRITGFTDRKGPENINQRISEQRARRAATLINDGSDKLTIDWIGEGARGMRAPYQHDSVLGRLLNRCAEIQRTWVNQVP